MPLLSVCRIEALLYDPVLLQNLIRLLIRRWVERRHPFLELPQMRREWFLALERLLPVHRFRRPSVRDFALDDVEQILALVGWQQPSRCHLIPPPEPVAIGTSLQLQLQLFLWQPY